MNNRVGEVWEGLLSYKQGWYGLHVVIKSEEDWQSTNTHHTLFSLEHGGLREAIESFSREYGWKEDDDEIWRRLL